MIEQLFEVATEFRFDVGQALVNTDALKGAVDDLSSSANSAMKSLGFLAGGLVAHLGFGSGGILTVLSKAVQLSESFDATGLQFATIISSNMNVLSGTIDNFNDRLGTSKMLLEKIGQTANKYAIPAGQLTSMTKLLAPALAQRGRLGTNFEGGIDMAKNVILASETLGLHPQVAAESLQHSLSGLPLHGKLFNRLVNTEPFSSAHIRTQSQLQALQTDKKMDLLAKALKVVSMDTDTLSYRLNSLNGQLTIARNMMSEAMSILQPIGEALKQPLISLLKWLNTELQSRGKALGQSIAKIISGFGSDPVKLYANLRQLAALGGDFRKALHLAELGAVFTFLAGLKGGFLKTLAEDVRVLGLTSKNWGVYLLSLSSIGRGLLGFVEDIRVFSVTLFNWGKYFITTFGYMRLIGNSLAFFFGRFIPQVMFFLALMQIISRARAIASANDVKNSLKYAEKSALVFLHLKEAFGKIIFPITYTIDKIASFISVLFETTFWLNYVLPALDFLAKMFGVVGDWCIKLGAVLNGLGNVIAGLIVNHDYKKDALNKNFAEGYRDFINEAMDKTKVVANYTVYNNNKIDARFDMREQLEPDRIAFAVTEHLKRLATNPRQARGSTSGKIDSGSTPFGAPK
jgi:hypothetical protein